MINFKSPPLPYFIESMQMAIAEGKSFPSRSSLGVFNILYVRKGKIFISDSNAEYVVKAGQYIVLRPDKKYVSTQACEQETLIEDIQFNTSALWEDVNAEGPHQLFGDYYSHILHMKTYHTIKYKRKFEATCDQLRRAARSGEADAFWERQQYFTKLLKLLDEEWRQIDAKASIFIAEKAAIYIKDNFDKPLTNTMLSHHLGYHINYIARSMDEVFGLTPQQYLLYYRLDQAKLMLIRTQLSIAEIANQTGFKQTPHFSRLFTNYVGVGPLKYRKKYTT